MLLGEVQIREAMQELRGWELSAEVKFLTQEESGRQVPLIKEWKDLFLEIGDKQSLLVRFHIIGLLHLIMRS